MKTLGLPPHHAQVSVLLVGVVMLTMVLSPRGITMATNMGQTPTVKGILRPEGASLQR